MTLDPEAISRLFGEAVSGEFMKTLTIFAVAAKIHSSGVAKEIKKQIAALTAVIREDLDEQRKLVGGLTERVATIEEQIKHKE